MNRITEEIKSVIRDVESSFPKAKGKFAQLELEKRIMFEVSKFIQNIPYIFIDIVRDDTKTEYHIIDILNRLEEGEDVIPINRLDTEEESESVPMKKVVENETSKALNTLIENFRIQKGAKQLLSACFSTDFFIPSTFFRYMLGRDHSRICWYINRLAGFGLLEREVCHGLLWCKLTESGKKYIETHNLPTNEYNYIGYIDQFFVGDQEEDRDWNLIKSYLIEKNSRKIRCPSKKNRSRLYASGIIEDMKDDNDQSVKLSKFGEYIRKQYMEQMEKMTCPTTEK